MGFQKMVDNSDMEQNTRSQKSAQQRTSVVSKKAQDTSKCQYDRHRASGKKEGE